MARLISTFFLCAFQRNSISDATDVLTSVAPLYQDKEGPLCRVSDSKDGCALNCAIVSLFCCVAAERYGDQLHHQLRLLAGVLLLLHLLAAELDYDLAEVAFAETTSWVLAATFRRRDFGYDNGRPSS